MILFYFLIVHISYSKLRSQNGFNKTPRDYLTVLIEVKLFNSNGGIAVFRNLPTSSSATNFKTIYADSQSRSNGMWKRAPKKVIHASSRYLNTLPKGKYNTKVVIFLGSLQFDCSFQMFTTRYQKPTLLLWLKKSGTSGGSQIHSSRRRKVPPFHLISFQWFFLRQT